MPKIPRGLSDKDMLKSFHDEPTVEEMLLAMDEHDDSPTPPRYVRRAPASVRNDEDPITVYLGVAGRDTLAKLLLDIKLDLYKSGVVDYHTEIKREGNRIVLTPIEKGR